MGHHHHHHHHDDHGHGLDPRAALRWALVLNAGFLLVEVAVGWWTGSLAVLSDATHMLSDVGALVLALAAAELARRPPSSEMTFGLARAEVLGAFLNGLFLCMAAGAIMLEAVHRLQGPLPEVAGWPVLVVGVLGLAINLGSVFALLRSDRQNLNIQGALAHMLADALGSVGAIVAAVGLLLGFPVADLVMSVLVVVLVLYGAVRLVRDAGRVLLQLPPKGLDVDGIGEKLLEVPGVCAIHDLHVWTIDGQEPIVTAHLVVEEESSLEATRQSATALLECEFGIDHATLQPERATERDAPGCGVTVVPRSAVSEARGRRPSESREARFATASGTGKQ